MRTMMVIKTVFIVIGRRGGVRHAGGGDGDVTVVVVVVETRW